MSNTESDDGFTCVARPVCFVRMTGWITVSMLEFTGWVCVYSLAANKATFASLPAKLAPCHLSRVELAQQPSVIKACNFWPSK